MSKTNKKLNGSVNLLATALRDVFTEAMVAVKDDMKNDIQGFDNNLNTRMNGIDKSLENLGKRMDKIDQSQKDMVQTNAHMIGDHEKRLKKMEAKS